MFLPAMRLLHRTENKLRTPKTWKKTKKKEKERREKCLVFNWSLTLELTELKYCFLEVCLCRRSHAGSSQ